MTQKGNCSFLSKINKLIQLEGDGQHQHAEALTFPAWPFFKITAHPLSIAGHPDFLLSHSRKSPILKTYMNLWITHDHSGPGTSKENIHV